MEISVEFLKDLKVELMNDAALTLLSMHLKEQKSEYNTETHTSMFTMPFFTMATLWNQPLCLAFSE
jgi:hypothetical protein